MLLLSNLKIQETTTENPHNSAFIFRYFPPTLGLTIGNCLRRVLLSTLSGVAAIGIEINDNNGPVKSKFSDLAGVDETTPYLILNCKKIIAEVKEKKDEIYCLEMDINEPEDKERIITAKDFQPNPHLEIKNPDLYLATLAPFSRLQIKLYFREDYGYYEAKIQKEFKWWKEYFAGKEHIIPLDTDYSPVKGDGVNFQVNSVVTGLEKEEEELKLTITTTGTISPRQALCQALEIIIQINDKIKNELVK